MGSESLVTLTFTKRYNFPFCRQITSGYEKQIDIKVLVFRKFYPTLQVTEKILSESRCCQRITSFGAVSMEQSVKIIASKYDLQSASGRQRDWPA